MAETAGTIQLSVQFKDAISNFKKVVDSLQGELNKLTPGTSIYKAIESDLKQAQKLVNKTDLQANTGLNKIGQLDTMVGDLQRVEGLLSRVQQLFGSVDLSHVNLNHESFAAFAQDIQAAKTELANLAKAKSELEGKNVKGLLASAGYTEAQMKKAGFKAGDLDQNAIEYYQRLGQAAAEAQQKVESLNQAQNSAQTLVNNNQAFLDSNKNAATIGALTGQLKGKYTGNDIARVYGNFVDQQHQQGTLQSDHVQNALRLIGLDDATINQIITSGADAKKRLEEALKNLYPNHGQNEYWGLKGAFEKNLKDPTQVGANTGGVSGRTGFSAALKEQEKATEEQLKHQQEVVQLQKEAAAAEKQVAKLETKSSALGNVISKTDYANLNTQINNIQSRIATLEAKILGSVQGAGLTPPGGGGGGIPTPPPDDPGARAQDAKQQAQEQMGNAINMMARRWLGTYAIVNKVRQAIRQAWTDIKALDKSMTNIAVVTNMSVNDLWGKINDYMSIAQQYGVSTQGVYEVSQLYYQQGLGTADVMAATTETLKMARIAGMEYADAADAMTVAIRSFKMEMTDAGHVTDVYSKVAASTASDSEELAIAMSKTASSAENVGSSFENTTAMLAVMIETTRESAQNLGSALKSIISRYGEMKVGATVDEDGEALDFNKVDTALQSVGISIKDAQGQFRDFDDVIFELSEKWDTLDKNTQRYIATIMAGNRQQSRFIALVDNWERLDEVANIADDSEDAGLLQYSKTLDSLESKISNLKTSFQQFYMDIANGPLFKSILTFLNNIVQGFTKVGKLFSVTTIANLILSVKSLFSIMAIMAKSTFADMYANYRAYQEGKTAAARQGNVQRSREEVQQDQQTQQQMLSRRQGRMKGKYTTGAVYGAQIAGSALSLTGASIVGKGGFENYKTGTLMSTAGNMLSMGATGFMMGGGVGAVIGVLAGIVTSLQSVAKIFDKNYELQLDYEEAKKVAEEKNVERAENKNQYNNLKTLLKQYEEADKTKYNDEESYQNWLDINNQLVEAYPELLGYIDAEGNAIADVTNKSELLSFYMNKAAEASKQYYDAKIEEIRAGMAMNANREYSYTAYRSDGSKNIMRYDLLHINKAKVRDKWGVDVGAYLANEFTQSIMTLGQDRAETHFKEYYTPETVMNWADSEGYDLKSMLTKYNIGDASTSERGIIGDLIKLGMIQEVGTDSGYYQFDEYFGNYLTKFLQEKELGTYQRGSATANLSILASGETIDDQIDDISGYTALLYTYAKEIGGMTDEKISGLTAASVDWQNLINAYQALYSNFSESEQRIISTLFDNISSISFPEIQRIFQQDLGIEDYQNNDLYKTFTKQWYNANYQQTSRWAQAIALNKGAYKVDENGVEKYDPFTNTEYAGKGLESFTTWMQHQGYTMEEAEKYYQTYFDTVKQALIASDKQLYSFLENSSDATVESYISYLSSEQKIIKEANTQASTIASSRQTEIRKIIEMSQDSSKGLGQLLSTDVVANTEFWSLLFTDVGSQQWATALEDFETEYGISIAEFENFVYENFNTYVNSIGENIQTSINSIDSLYESQTKGFEFDKAIKLFNEVAKDGETWDDIFTYTEDGKLVLQNFDEILARKKDNTITKLAKMREGYNKATDALLTTITKDTEYSELQALTADILKNQYGFSGPQADEIVNWIANNTNGTAKEFIAFLESQGMILEEAERYYNESKDAINRQAEEAAFKTKAQNAAATLEGEFNAVESAYQLLANTGLTGYSADDAGQLIAAGILTQDAFKKQTDGTYNIIRSSLQDIPTWVSNAITALIVSETKAAKESLISLSNSVSQGKGEVNASDYLEFFTHLKDDVNFEDIVSKAYAEILSDDASASKLAKLIKDEYTARGIEIDDAQLEALTREAVAAYIDGQLEHFKSTNDLILQYITGEINKQDYLKLQAELGSEIEKFSNTTEESISNYTTRILKNTALTFKEKLESLGEGYEILIDDLFGKEDAVYNIKNTAFENKNRYSMKDLPSLMSYIRMILGEQDWESLFNYNVADNTYTVKASELMRGEGVSDEVFQAYQNLFKASNELGKEAKFNALLEAITTFASGQETTVEGLINTYKELGLSLNPDHAAKLIAGGSESIIEDLKTQFTDGNETLIAEAIEEGTYTLFESIAGILQSAIEGSASYADIKTLAQATGLDLTGYLISTGYGTYGINQQGALAVSSYRAEKTEDYIGEAISLLDAYYDEGIFENFKSLEDTIQVLEDATKEQIEVTEDQIASDKEINETSKELTKEQKKAQLEILRVAQGIYEYRKASEAANFMGTDPFGGALADYDAYLNSRKTAKQVLEEAYNNKGVIADYTQAAQLLNFIGYGEDWSDSQKIRNQNILLKYTGDEGTDFVSALSEIFGQDFANVAEALGEAAEKMDNSANKLEKFYNTRATADEAYLDGMKVVQERLAKQEIIPITSDSWAGLESFISKNYKEILNDTFTAQDILKLQFGKDYANTDYNADTIQTYLEGFIESVKGFIYDPNSELTAQQQFTSHLKGLQESTELEARLQALEDQLIGIKELGITDPIVDGLAEAIDQAEELQKILTASGIKIELPSKEPDNVMNPEEEETARGLNISSQANSKLDTQLAELKAKNEGLTAQVTSLSSTVSDQNIILETLQGQNEELVVEIDNLKAANEAQKTELNAANAELEALEAENTNLSGQIVEKEGTIAEFNAKITELEIEKEALTTQINEAAEQLKSSQDKNEELATLIDTLNKQKLGTDAEKARLEGEVAQLTGEKTALEIQLKNKEKEYNELLNRKSTSEQGEDTQPGSTPAPLPPPAAPQNTPAPPSDPEDLKRTKSLKLDFNDIIDGLSDLVDTTESTAQQEADYYKQLIQQMDQEREEAKKKIESSPTLLSEYQIQYADKYLRADGEWNQQHLAYTRARNIAKDTIDETEEIREEIQAIKEEAASITLITDDTEAQAALDNLNAKISKLVSSYPTLFVNVKFNAFTLEDIALSFGENAKLIEGEGQYTGNVNGIAYANGNVDSLIAGANLANKTLVGELGPELGVWDGMYHLLGQNGAEFVNMPSDAIVFNHRQTEGIFKGQQGYRGRALANGTGETFDKVLLPQWGAGVTFADIVSGFTGNNNGKKIETTEIEGLEEWYNLLRKIAKLESEINLIRAERENIYDGHDYLKNLREEQASLNEQIAVQKLLVDYQKEQLQLERERIEQNKFWSESLTFNEDNTLLSVFGNETKGGKGVFAFLDQLKELDGNSQLQLIKKIGYTYKGRDGKQLDGQELVQQFIKEYQDIVGSYNELDTSILEAETTIQELITEINSLEQAIKDNQKKLEKTIYDILIEAAELEIEQMEEQNELTKEANQKYVEGLSNALSKEQQLYEENKSIEEREALQRQLALLRRSGGSASEIEALEQQLDDTLKNEYFDKQQQMIEDISKANERQAELMEQQVKLQQEALEYQKKNGVLWTDVYKVMNGSYEEILAFITGTDTEFFEASALVQETMLLDWAKMIGIYDEDRGSKAMTAEAQSHWEDGTVLSNLTEEQQGHYAKLSDQDKTAAQKHYNSVYTSSRLDGMTDEEARKAARDSMVERLRVDEELGITRWDPRGDGNGNGSGANGGSGEELYHYTFDFNGTRYEHYKSRQTAEQKINDLADAYIKDNATYKGKSYTRTSPPRSADFATSAEYSIAKTKYDGVVRTADTYAGWAKASIKAGYHSKGYSQGGLVDYTGIAMVHGSKSKPESFLNAEQTAQITAALRETTGKESVLGSLQSTMDKLKSVIHNFSTINNSNTQSISIAPGAVVIQVEQLADSYDIEEVSRDVMNRMVAIANKATNRGVNRR